MAAAPHRLWRDDPARAELHGLYKEVDELLGGTTCDVSTDCCHFGRTGRAPYPTAAELAELELAVAALGGVAAVLRDERRRSKGRPLPLADDEGRCPFLSSEGRCRVYEARPFGCRTFFCDRARHPDGRRGPRDAVQALGRRVAALSARSFAGDAGPRPFESALADMQRGVSVLRDRKSLPPRRGSERP